MQPFVSICIPVYNGEDHLQKCLDSAISQSFLNIEIIIVNDSSTDNSQSIINRYALKDKRIKVFINPTNLGLTGNWNKCIELSSGEWIKFLFQDDYLTNNCIERMLNDTLVNDSLLVCKRTFLLDENADEATKAYYGEKVVTFKKLGVPDETTFLSSSIISRFACENICLNFIGEPTSYMFRKKLVNTIGLFNTHLSQLCDFEFALRIGSNYGITYIPEKLTFFRIHDLSTTSSNLSKKYFVLRHLEPIITVHQMLYDSKFLNFRSLISFPNKIKLKQFLSVRTYEAFINADGNAEYLKLINKVSKQFPALKKLMKADFFTSVKLKLVFLKRKIRSFFI
jgi:glycosyltransferase involved in cell wall biosynthesis